MASHLSSIGFLVDTSEDLERLAEELLPVAEAVTVKKGRYLRWTGANGEQLWLQVNSRRELVGINPHFAGQTRLSVGVVARVSRTGDTDLDGGFQAWASPSHDHPGEGEYPFVFDAPDAAIYSNLDVPSVAEAQITAFAHEIALFDSEEAYNSSQDRGGIRFASKSFVPSGMSSFGDKAAPPTAEAMFTGQILQAEFRTNTFSRKPFWWAVVDTLGGQYDVVADPLLLDKEPVIGGYLSGVFWLSGRLMTYSPKKSWIRRVLGRNG